VGAFSYERGISVGNFGIFVTFGVDSKQTFALEDTPRSGINLDLGSFFFFTLVTGPGRSLSLKLSDARVYEPQIPAST